MKRSLILKFSKWIVVGVITVFMIGFGLVFLYNIHPHRNNDNSSKRAIVIADTFTAAAYRRGGFYDYYCSHLSAQQYKGKSNYQFCQMHNVKCGSECLTIKVTDDATARNATPRTLYALKKSIENLDVITDSQLSKHPEVLDKYDKVIVLHNEYVTQTEFDAISHYKKVIYLYPNAPYAEVSYNPAENTITLIRGHGYPDKSIGNGFGWKYDNTREEYDRDCNNWAFHKLYNGIQLNCYPEMDVKDNSPILEDSRFLEAIRDY